VIHDRMLDDPIQGQGQGHRGLKCVKMADYSNSVLGLFYVYFCLRSSICNLYIFLVLQPCGWLITVGVLHQ